MADNRLLQNLLRLRIAVGLLGEKSQHAWWTTTFFEPRSRAFLDPVFVRTALAAQYSGATEAARRVHDASLGVGNFHLFRLPEETEQDLHAMVLAWSRSGREQAPIDAAEAQLTLGQFAVAGDGTAPGPRLIGQRAALDSLVNWQQAAAVYRDAFQGGYQAYPYFTQA